MITELQYDNNNMPQSIKAGNVLDMEYSFNPVTGNLDWRKDKRRDITENFTYDNLDRLTGASTTTGTSIAVGYYENGNISAKTDVGDYLYNPPAHPHAVSAIEMNPGTITTSQDISYTPFNQVSTIDENNLHTRFLYGPDYQRRMMEVTQGTTTQLTRYYACGVHEKDITPTGTRQVDYISTGEGLQALHVTEPNGTEHIYYTHTDYLGSLLVLTDEQGNPIQENSFDAWGRRRNPDTWGYTNLPTPTLTHRGYTGHEHLDHYTLINMNGRLYDPQLSRMLSPDNFVQLPDYSQSFNRYSYAWNNPLIFTDPSGEFIGFIVAGAVIGGYVGGAIQQGEAAFWNWDKYFYKQGDFWNAVGVGAIAGASVGAGIAGVLGANGTGMSTAANMFGKNYTSLSWEIFSHGLINADVNMLMVGSRNNWNTGLMLEAGSFSFATGAIMTGVVSQTAGYKGINAKGFSSSFGGWMEEAELLLNRSVAISTGMGVRMIEGHHNGLRGNELLLAGVYGAADGYFSTIGFIPNKGYNGTMGRRTTYLNRLRVKTNFFASTIQTSQPGYGYQKLIYPDLNNRTKTHLRNQEWNYFMIDATLMLLDLQNLLY